MNDDVVDRQSGAGTPRSADTDAAGGGRSGDPVDPAMNRSGSGGSGGPGEGGQEQEGSTGQSMDELLGGETSGPPT